MRYTIHMLSLFPQILFLSPFSATLLRFAAGTIFLLAAMHHYSEREELGKTPFMVVGSGAWIPIFAALIELAVGGALMFGIYTQAAALIGALLALKQFVWKRRYPHFFPLSRTASALLFVICISLLVTGPGLFAFDLPL